MFSNLVGVREKKNEKILSPLATVRDQNIGDIHSGSDLMWTLVW